MFKNYLKVAARNLLKYKGHAFITIAGFAIGIAACLLLFLWIQDELNFDRHHKNADRIYRVFFQTEENGVKRKIATTPAPLEKALMAEFPWIEKTVQVLKSKGLVTCRDKSSFENIYFSDPQVFDIFDIPLTMGNPATALKEPFSILISEEMKKKYFGNEDPIGKIIQLYEEYDYKITGVFKNIPANSHFHFQFLASFNKRKAGSSPQWGIGNYHTYILVRKDAPLDTFAEKMPEFVAKYQGKGLRDLYKMTYGLQPLTRIHLFSQLQNELEPNGSITLVYIFSAIALFILLLACLNYINLATARFTNRAREAGLRKVLGATSAQLNRQLLGESFLLVLISLFPAILLAELCLPLFNSLSGKELAFHYFNNMYLIGAFLGIVVGVGFFSGAVPAWFFSNFPSNIILKRIFKTGSLIPILRRSLVVFQFIISISLSICMILIYHQLYYMRSQGLGFDKDHIINVKINKNEEALLKYQTIKQEFLQGPNVMAVSVCGFSPGIPRWNNNYWIDGMAANEYRMIYGTAIDYDFIDTFRLNIIEGRGFSPEFSTDEEGAFIINQAAMKEFGWNSAVGKNFKLSVDWRKGTIIGVVEDFHFDSLQKEICPVVFFIDPPSFEYFSVRIQPINIPETIEFLKSKWEKLVHGEPFNYTFIDDDYNRLYKSENRLGKIFIIATCLTLFISCLGLFGLAAFTAEQRSKEIGIRKVMGASAPEIVFMLSKEFSLWVLLANIFAWPIAFYAMKQWLQNFAYRITILPWPFLLAGFVALIIALISVGYKAIRAALANPVEALRYE